MVSMFITSGDHNQGQIRLVEYGAEKYHKDTDIATQTQSFAMTDPVAHEAVVLVGRIAQHKGADNRQKSDQQDQAIRSIGVRVPHETEKQEGVGITIQYRIKPAAVRTALIREPGHFAVAAVYDRGELCHKYHPATAPNNHRVQTGRRPAQSTGMRTAIFDWV